MIPVIQLIHHGRPMIQLIQHDRPMIQLIHHDRPMIQRIQHDSSDSANSLELFAIKYDGNKAIITDLFRVLSTDGAASCK